MPLFITKYLLDINGGHVVWSWTESIDNRSNLFTGNFVTFLHNALIESHLAPLVFCSHLYFAPPQRSEQTCVRSDTLPLLCLQCAGLS